MLGRRRRGVRSGARAVAEAQLNITITEGRTRPCRSPSCRSAGRARAPAAFDIAGVVSADLGSSGRFAPMATSDMVSRPTQASQVNFQQWRTLDADYLVIGTLTEDAPDSFTADVPALRRAARRVADGLQAAGRGAPTCAERRIASPT